MAKSKKYYTLLTADTKGGKLSPQFGDYDKECVKQEKEDSYGMGYFDMQIIATDDDQVSISAKVVELNKARGF